MTEVVADTIRGGMTVLGRELAAYEQHRDELLRSSAGKFVLVKGDDIVDVLETQRDAIHVGYQKFGNVPFLVKRVTAVDAPVELCPF
jgi:hypothetical protein